MHTSLFTIIFLAASAMAQKRALSDASSFGAMLKRGDTILKRQGYTPVTSDCGSGDTCAEACGADSVECPSTDTSYFYCHSSTDGSACCPDGSGNSCRAGFYCTSDIAGDTYCCPDGIDTANCAAQYSLTVSLIRQTPVLTPSATSLVNSLPAESPVSTSLIHISGVTSAQTSAAISTAIPNATFSAPTPPQFTGGAVKIAGAGAVVLAGAMGFAGLL